MRRGAIGDLDGAQGLRDRRRHAKGGERHHPPVARGHIPVRVITIGGVFRPRHGDYNVWARRIHRADRSRGVRVRADIGFGRDVAEPVIGHIDRRRARPRRHRIGRHPVQAVVKERFAEPLAGVRAGGEVGERVELVAQLLQVRRTLGRADRGQPPGLRVVKALLHHIGDACAER